MKAMLSIKPEYVARILSGEKTYEYRRRIFKRRDVDTLVIYETSPSRAVVAEASITGIIAESPEDLWERTHENAGIDRDRFMAYFKGRDVAYAIELGKITRYDRPRDLREYAPTVKAPPQSYVYITRQEPNG